MAKINIDFEAQELIEKSKMSEDAAVQAMLLVAKYLRKGKSGGSVLPLSLAGWLADAIEKSMAMPSDKQRARVLTDELGITKSKPRPVAKIYEVGQFIEEKIETDGMSNNEAYGYAEDKFDIGFGTVKKYFKVYKKELKDIAEQDRENDEWERSK
jgi:hypothetical protein